MELDPRIAAIIGCAVLMLAGVSIPDETDVIKQVKSEIEDWQQGYDWCGENERCKKTALNSMKALDVSLSAYEMQNNIRLVLFWGGLLGVVSSGVSLTRN